MRHYEDSSTWVPEYVEKCPYSFCLYHFTWEPKQWVHLKIIYPSPIFPLWNRKGGGRISVFKEAKDQTWKYGLVVRTMNDNIIGRCRFWFPFLLTSWVSTGKCFNSLDLYLLKGKIFNLWGLNKCLITLLLVCGPMPST